MVAGGGLGMRRLGRILCALHIHWPLPIFGFTCDTNVRDNDNRPLHTVPFWQCMCGSRKRLLKLPETPQRPKGESDGTSQRKSSSR